MFLHYTDGAHLLTERRVNKLKNLLNGLVSSLSSERRSGLPSRISARTVPTFQRKMILPRPRMMTLILMPIFQPASDREYVSLKKTDDDTDGESESLEEK